MDGKGNMVEGDENYVQKFLNSDLVNLLIEDQTFFDSFFEFSDIKKHNWELIIDEGTNKCYRRKEEGENLVSILSECVIEAPMAHCTAILCELDLYKEWMETLNNIERVALMTPYKQVARVVLNFGALFSPREVVMRTSGLMSLEKGGVLGIVKSVDQDSLLGT